MRTLPPASQPRTYPTVRWCLAAIATYHAAIVAAWFVAGWLR